MKAQALPRLPILLAIGLLVPAATLLRGADWPEWRGPARTGVSAETGLPSSWSPSGQNLAWKAPYGGRSGPVVFGDHLYLQNTSGSGAMEQERLMCFNADTGKLLWEHKYNIFASDVPAHRIAWASPAVDPASGNVFAFSANGVLMSFTKDGKLIWERSLTEEFGMWTTHGGRLSSPIIDGQQVIVSGLMFSWGQHAGGAHRFLSLDKSTGKVIWLSSPEGRPTDTIYANPYVADVNGTRMLFSGGSDGAILGLKIATGEKVWSWLVSKRGLNTAALMVGSDVIVSHSEENIPTNEMGMLAAVPADSKGTLEDKSARWLTRGIQAGYGSPVSDGERIYVADNGGILFAFDAKSGKQLWEENLGTLQKSSPVLADGKLYVGTENGKFFIIRPHADRAEVLDQDWLGSQEKPEVIIASPAVARGRIYVASMEGLYAIGPKTAPASSSAPSAAPATTGTNGKSAGPAAVLLVNPTELILKPGESVALTVRALDDKGQELAAPGQATWTLENLKGTVTNGNFTRRLGVGRPGRSGEGRCRFADGRGPHPRHSRSTLDLRFREWRRNAAARGGRTPPGSSPCAISMAARSWSSSQRTISRSPNAAGRSSAAASSATTRLKRTCAPSSAGVNVATSAWSRSATSSGCRALTIASS